MISKYCIKSIGTTLSSLKLYHDSTNKISSRIRVQTTWFSYTNTVSFNKRFSKDVLCELILYLDNLRKPTKTNA